MCQAADLAPNIVWLGSKNGDTNRRCVHVAIAARLFQGVSGQGAGCIFHIWPDFDRLFNQIRCLSPQIGVLESNKPYRQFTADPGSPENRKFAVRRRKIRQVAMRLCFRLHLPRCRWPFRGTIARTLASKCRPGFASGLGVKGERPAYSIAFAAFLRTAC